MGAAAKISDYKMLSSLSPLNRLDADKCNELIQKSTFRHFQAGERIYKLQNDTQHVFYLIAGSVEHIQGGKKTLLKVGSAPLSAMDSNNSQLIAKTPTTLFVINQSFLDLLLNWGDGKGYEVDEITSEQEGAWMQHIVQNPAFVKLSPTNIQAIMACIQTVSVKAGQPIIQQGERDKYYYIISKGCCRVSKKHKNGKETVLAELGEGDSFGEEALIANTVRNASVTMVEDGLLLRLDQQDFTQFLKNKMIDYVSAARAEKLIAEGGQWIDVRTPEEHTLNGIGLNMPLGATRIIANELHSKRAYVLFCDDTRSSSVAAFLLRQRGYEVYVLEGGLQQNPIHEAPQNSQGNNLYYLKPQPVNHAELNELRSKEEAYLQKIATLETELNKSQVHGKGLEKYLHSAKADLEKYAKINATLKQQTSEQATRYSTLEKQHEQSLSAIDQLKVLIEEKEKQITSLQKSHAQTLERTTSARHALSQQLAAAQDEKRAYIEEYTRLNTELAAQQQVNGKLNGQIGELQQTSDGHLARLAALEATLRATHTLNTSQEAQLDEQGDVIKNLEAQLKQTLAAHGDEMATIKAAHHQQAEMLNALQALEADYRHHQATTAKLEQAYQSARAQNEQLQSSLDQLNQTLSHNNKQYEVEIDRYKQMIRDLERSLHAATATQQTLRNTITTLDAQVTELTNQGRQESQSESALLAMNNQLQAKINELTARIDALGNANTNVTQQYQTELAQHKHTITILETALNTANTGHHRLILNVQTLESRTVELTRQLTQENANAQARESQLTDMQQQLQQLTQRAVLAEQTVEVLEFQLTRQQQSDEK